MNISKDITKKKDFRNIVISVIDKMFTPLKDDLGSHALPYKTVYVDLNSVLSIVFRYDNLDDDEMISGVTFIIENFVDTCLARGITVYFLYTREQSIVRTTICPDWCKKRFERVNINNADFILRILNALFNFSKKNNLIKIENIRDKHVAHVIKQLQVNNEIHGYGLVISKDYVCQSLVFSANLTVYTGINFIDFRDNEPELYDRVNILPILPKRSLYWIYPTLCRDSRNEYVGYRNMGSFKVNKYINKYRIELFLNKDHPVKEFLEKHQPLYDVDEMIIYYDNIKNVSS